jgi:hypothetical protein
MKIVVILKAYDENMEDFIEEGVKKREWKWFLCGLFNYGVSSSGYVASDDRINDELERM